MATGWGVGVAGGAGGVRAGGWGCGFGFGFGAGLGAGVRRTGEADGAGGFSAWVVATTGVNVAFAVGEGVGCG